MRLDAAVMCDSIAATIESNYGVRPETVRFLLEGYDPNAMVYQLIADDGAEHFLKVKRGGVDEQSLLVPSALDELGVPNILAPLRTRSSNVWCRVAGDKGLGIILFPFVHGTNAMHIGMTDLQWRTFGTSLRAVHASGLERSFHRRIRSETFTLPSAARVREMQDLADREHFSNPIATTLAEFWRENRNRIDALIDRAESLGRSLQSRSFEMVLCHSDIHAANILVADDGRIWLVDWDEPIIAPRERDLQFIVGSHIARTVEPNEEELFFEAYGPTEIDPGLLAYYRYERTIEDLGEFANTTFLDDHVDDCTRAEALEYTRGFFEPGGDVDRAEVVCRSSWPGDH
jgi:spectinomycin phosphotransferase